MSEKQTKSETKPKPRPKIRRAIVELLAAVDRSIEAAEDAKRARRAFLRLAERIDEGGRQ